MQKWVRHGYAKVGEARDALIAFMRAVAKSLTTKRDQLGNHTW